MAGGRERLLRAGPACFRRTGAACAHDRAGSLRRWYGYGCTSWGRARRATAPPAGGHGRAVHRVHLWCVESQLVSRWAR